jgi:hypothetical protein
VAIVFGISWISQLTTSDGGGNQTRTWTPDRIPPSESWRALPAPGYTAGSIPLLPSGLWYGFYHQYERGHTLMPYNLKTTVRPTHPSTVQPFHPRGCTVGTRSSDLPGWWHNGIAMIVLSQSNVRSDSHSVRSDCHSHPNSV